MPRPEASFQGDAYRKRRSRGFGGARQALQPRIEPDVPSYEVTVQGRGIVVPMEASFAVGFLRLVQVRAVDPVEAEVRAVELVRSEWSSSLFAAQNRGGAPYLTIIRIGILSWWSRFLGSPGGYMFFAEDGVLMPSSPGRRVT